MNGCAEAAGRRTASLTTNVSRVVVPASIALMMVGPVVPSAITAMMSGFAFSTAVSSVSSERTGVEIEYVPILLGGLFKLTNNRSPVETNAGVRNKPEYQKLETERFIRQHGITRYRHNPFFPVNTLMIMRGAVAARGIGLFERYVDELVRSDRQHSVDPSGAVSLSKPDAT